MPPVHPQRLHAGTMKKQHQNHAQRECELIPRIRQFHCFIHESKTLYDEYEYNPFSHAHRQVINEVPECTSRPSRPPLRMSIHQLANSHTHTACVSIHIEPLCLRHCNTSDYAHITITPSEVVDLFLRPRAPEQVTADPCTAWTA